ncbi:nitroreductase family deazaflavin-dependent oxidoreductase [bacterium]|nr:nitroreductase family deazaflavin-dependent oxidoreductase [bacterium]
MKRGEKLEIEKLAKPAFMTDGEWEATLETLSMLNQTIPDEVWSDVEDKVTSLTRIRSDGRDDREKFLSSDGKEFEEPGIAPTLLLTTIGRKSGKEFTTPVNAMPDGDNFFVVASLAGYDTFPHWYLNLEKNPRVWVQVKDKKVPATARRLNREEKAPLWPRLLAEGQPLWAYFQVFTEREFPVVLITPEK